MKKNIGIILAGIISCIALCGCNKDMINTNYTFNKAYISVGSSGGMVIMEVEVKQWRDYEDGDQIQITAEDGTVYLTSANNVVLIKTTE